MNHEQAADIIRQLADGLDPSSGEPLAANGVCQRPQILRALFFAKDALERLSTRGASPGKSAENAGAPWSEEEDRLLEESHDAGMPVQELAARSKRSVAAIRARLVKLGRLPESASRFRV